MPTPRRSFIRIQKNLQSQRLPIFRCEIERIRNTNCQAKLHVANAVGQFCFHLQRGFAMSRISTMLAAFALTALVPFIAVADHPEDSKMKKCAQVCSAARSNAIVALSTAWSWLPTERPSIRRLLNFASTAPSVARHVQHCALATARFPKTCWNVAPNAAKSALRLVKSFPTMNTWLLVPSPVEIARSTVPTCQNTIISKSGKGQRFALGEELLESQEMRLEKMEQSNGQRM